MYSCIYQKRCSEETSATAIQPFLLRFLLELTNILQLTATVGNLSSPLTDYKASLSGSPQKDSRTFSSCIAPHNSATKPCQATEI